MCDERLCCVMRRRRREAGGWRRRARDTESKTRTPHKDVGAIVVDKDVCERLTKMGGE